MIRAVSSCVLKEFIKMRLELVSHETASMVWRFHSRNVDVMNLVQVFNLTHGKIKEGHSISDLDSRFGTNTAHGCSKTTVQLEDGKFVENASILSFWEIVVVMDLSLGWRVDLIPITVMT